MSNTFANILEAFSKHSPRFVWGSLVATSLLLFLPTKVAQFFSVEGFQSGGARVVVGLLWLVAFSFALINLIAYLKGWVDKSRASQSELTQRTEFLETLTREEKGYLLPYLRDGKNTCVFELSDGIAQGLVKKGILFRASDVSVEYLSFPYNLFPWAREELARRPQLLDGAAERHSRGGRGRAVPIT